MSLRTSDELRNIWTQLSGWGLTDYGMNSLKKWMKRFSLVEIAEAIRLSVKQYLSYDDADPLKATQESATKAFDYIPKICVGQRRSAEKPYLKDLYYVRGILKNRLHYLNEWQALQMLEQTYLLGIGIEQLKELAKAVKNWTAFKEAILTLQKDNARDDTV